MSTAYTPFTPDHLKGGVPIGDNDGSWYLTLLRTLRRENFYGKLILELKKGKVVLVRKEETIKPPNGL